MNTSLHPCMHCRKVSGEQRRLNDWADAQFGGRLPIVTLAAWVSTFAEDMLEQAAAGDADRVLDSLASMVMYGYRIAEAYEVDLWERVTAKIAEAQGNPAGLERF